MKKVVTLICVFSFLITIFSGSVFAAQSKDSSLSDDLVLYDYKTQTETLISKETVASYSEIYSSTDKLLVEKNIIREVSEFATKPQVGTKSIIGLDARVPTPPTSDPYSGVMLLSMRVVSPEGEEYVSQATGFLVAPNVLVSCAHSLVYTGTDRVIEMKVYANVHQASLNGCDYVHPESWIYSTAYLDNPNDRKNDWVVIKLQENISGYYFTCTPNRVSVGTSCYISGYPGDHNYYQYTSEGYLYCYSATDVAHYTNDTVGGMSGAPVYTDSNICFAIHTSGTADGVTNSGCPITQGVYDSICYVIDNS